MPLSTLDVLLNLLDTHYDSDQTSPSKEAMRNQLLERGLEEQEVHRAVDWLNNIAEDTGSHINHARQIAYRVFSPYEKRFINDECINFIYRMEKKKILDGRLREHVVDQILLLQERHFSLEKLKWLVLMVLSNQDQHQDRYALAMKTFGEDIEQAQH